MPPRIVCIVEGQGEVKALPVLLRRLGSLPDVGVYPEIPHPIRKPRSKLRAAGGLEREVERAARKCGADGAIFILLDADDEHDCPARLGPELLARARAARPDRRIALALAKREYEAWFLAAAESLRGCRGLAADLAAPPDPESVRDAKGWLNDRMRSGYSASVDQPALTAQFDFATARAASDSFDKCFREAAALLAALRPAAPGVPQPVIPPSPSDPSPPSPPPPGASLPPR